LDAVVADHLASVTRLSVAEVAWRAGVGRPAVWLDRSSAPQRGRHRVPAARVAENERLRRQRMSGAAIAHQLAIPASTTGGILRRVGLGKLAAPEPGPLRARADRRAAPH
jgi:hypothetical protein